MKNCLLLFKNLIIFSDGSYSIDCFNKPGGLNYNKVTVLGVDMKSKKLKSKKLNDKTNKILKYKKGFDSKNL